MPILSRGMSLVILALTFAMHGTASGQTGSLHKRVPMGPAMLPVAPSPAASSATTALPMSPGRSGGRIVPSPLSPHASGRLPASVGANGTARILPMGPPAFTDGVPPGIERASQVAAPQASSGLERARAVTAERHGPSQAVQPVGLPPAQATPRWRDRLRFAWPQAGGR